MEGSFSPQRFTAYGALVPAPLFDDGRVVGRKDYTYTVCTSKACRAGITAYADTAGIVAEACLQAALPALHGRHLVPRGSRLPFLISPHFLILCEPFPAAGWHLDFAQRQLCNLCCRALLC